MQKVWQFLSSMRLGIILLLVLAGVSIIGTLFPDNQRAIQAVYASPWYIAIMAFLTVNLTICSINRINSIWSKVFTGKVTAGEMWLKQQPNNETIAFNDKPGAAVEYLQSRFKSKGFRTLVNKTKDGTVVYGDKGRFGHFGSLVTHISIIVILLGALWGAMGKYEDFRLAFPGDIIHLEEQGFSVRVEDFRLAYLDNEHRSIDQYYCDLTVIDQGRRVKEETIYVNKPLRYNKVNFYQSSYGWGTRMEINGDPVERPLRAGEIYCHEYEPVHLHVQILDIYPDFAMTDQGMPVNRSQYPANPYVLYRLYVGEQLYGNNFYQTKAGEDKEIPLPWDDQSLTLTFPAPVLWTGLQIVSIPGNGVVLLGSVLMMIGLFISFYMTPRRYWVLVKDAAGNGSQLLIAGGSSRNRMAFHREFKKTVEDLAAGRGQK